MQQVRLWEITPDRKLSEIQARSSGLEQWLEDWLARDISVLDPGLMVIGRQVRTGFGGVIDLLCIDGDGDLVVVQLKNERTPREVTGPGAGLFLLGQGPGVRRGSEHSRQVTGRPRLLLDGFQRKVLD